MQPLRYSINVTLDGCCHHEAIVPDESMHRHAEQGIAGADVLLFGRVTYGMMEEGWRPVAETGRRPEWMEGWMVPFAEVIHRARKVVVSDTLASVDWNAEILRGADLEAAVRRLKAEPGRGILTGGVTLPRALMVLGLIDEVEVLVHPRIAGHGPRPFEGLERPVDLEPIGRTELASGAVALRFRVVG